MTAKIIAFPKDESPDDALEQAKGAFASVFIMGVTPDDRIATYSAGPLSTIEVMGLLATMQHLVMGDDTE